MKTPDEIKKGLECRIRMRSHSCDCRCSKCDLYVQGYLNDQRWSDSLAYIQQLEADACNWEIEATLLKQKVEQL